MTTLTHSGRLPRLLAAGLLAIAALLPAAAPSLAADVTFGTPKAEAVYGKGVTFSVPMTAAATLDRLEIRLTYPGALGPFIEVVPVPPGGQPSYTLDLTGGSHIVPNTTIAATWAAVPSGGGEPVLSAPVTARYSDTAQEWKTMKGDVVVVHWYAGDEAFARKALEIGDRAVKETADLLGVTETEPIDFFIYGDNTAFRTALGPGTRENVGGQAHANIRTLFALIEPSSINDSWVSVVVPHELTHLVFDTAVENPYRFPPRWVNEGLAVYLSEGYTPTDRSLVQDAVDGRELLPLTALTGQFPTDPDKTYLAYSESVSAIDHLVRTHGEDALFSLIGAYKDGLTDDAAFERAINQDVAGFQGAWLAELGADAPVAYGPMPNPSGPLPPGWDSTTPDATARPGATPGTEPPADDKAPTTGGGEALILGLAVLGVVVVVIVGLVVARRRTAVP